MDDEGNGQQLHEVIINGTSNGLGMRIVGGRNMASNQESEFGIFIKEVIKGSLAAKDGRLERGDQLIEANSNNLVGVSNERAVAILKDCAMSDQIKLLISRSSKSREEFRRLSTSLLLQPLKGISTQGDGVPQLNNPVATSTPRAVPNDKSNKLQGDNRTSVGVRESALSEATTTVSNTNTRPSSASSELTQISTTDIETDDDIDRPIETRDQHITGPSLTLATTGRETLLVGSSPSPVSVALSDVVVTVGSLGPGMIGNGTPDHSRTGSGDHPPPIPTSPPPMFEEPLIQPKRQQPKPSEIAMTSMGPAAVNTAWSRSPPEGKSVSPPQSATLLASLSSTSHTFVIPKESGLGIIIGGGINRQDGPHVFIDKIMDGMDAAKNGHLKKGDRIISVNGVLFNNMTREKALTTLTQIKIRAQVKTYTIVIERLSAIDSNMYTTGPLSTLPQPPRSSGSSIFDSDTLPVSDQPNLKPTDSLNARTSAPEVYYKLPKREHDQDHADHTHRKVEGRVEESPKKSTPLRYLSKKDSSGRGESSKYDSLQKRLSMEPSARVKLSKLEWALSYMGYIMTQQQQQQIRSLLDISEDGRVIFSEFVNLAKELFAFKLDDAHLEANLVYALTQKDSLDMPALPRKATSYDQLTREYSPAASQMKLATSQPLLVESNQELELDQMRQQLHDLGHRRDQLRLSDTSGISDISKQRAEKERALHAQVQLMQKQTPIHETGMPQDMSSASTEDANTVLKRRAGLAEAAARASREKANQLEDSIRHMEAELSVLREHQGDKSVQDLRAHLAAMDCELRKEKATSRRFQVATEHLLQFVENCHEALVKSPDADRILYHPHGKGESVARGDAVTGNPRPPKYLSRHAKVTATTLAQEAKDTITAVQKLLHTETLPFGWDVAYTETGQKYYINHETKTTSWTHPVTKVNVNHGSRVSSLTHSHASSQSTMIGRSNPP